MNKRELALNRSKFYQDIRNFFNGLDYVEIETPILSTSLIPESAIEVFESQRVLSDGRCEPLFLTPSPEIYMKTLISEGIGDCYQLTKSFRNLEDASQKHANEFTMLEWYAMNFNYKDNIKVTQNLLRQLAPKASDATRHLFTDFIEVTMHELFHDYVNIDLAQAETLAQLQNQARKAGFSEYVDKSLTWGELFNFIFVAHIERQLPADKTVFVTNYPVQIPTTAKRNASHYERWELYMQGWEIANCYTEEARYDAMFDLFKQEAQLKLKMKVPHPVNYEYLNIFKNNAFPQCSGVALGVDRLFAVLQNAASLDEVSLI